MLYSRPTLPTTTIKGTMDFEEGLKKYGCGLMDKISKEFLSIEPVRNRLKVKELKDTFWIVLERKEFNKILKKVEEK